MHNINSKTTFEMHALGFGWGTPFGDFGFGNRNTHADYIYNPHPFHFSKNFIPCKKIQDMFESVYSCKDPNKEGSFLIATGHQIGESHYIVVLQDQKGDVIDLNVTDLSEEVF